MVRTRRVRAVRVAMTFARAVPMPGGAVDATDAPKDRAGRVHAGKGRDGGRVGIEEEGWEAGNSHDWSIRPCLAGLEADLAGQYDGRCASNYGPHTIEVGANRATPP